MMDSIVKYVSYDKDVKINQFEDYLERYNLADNQQFSSKETPKFIKEDQEGFSLLQKYATRGATSRPGFGSSGVETDRLRNAPDEEGIFEVETSDTIPLSTYKKMSIDPAIAKALLLVKGWIGGLKYSVKTSDPEMEAVVKYALDKIWTGLTSDMLDAFIYGFQFGEKVWQREDVELEDPLIEGDNKVVFKGKIVTYKKIKFLDPDLDFKYFKDKSDEIVKVVQVQSGGEVTVPRDKLVWFALDKKHSNIFGSSRLRSVYEDWYYSKINKQYWLMDLENRGAPALEVRYPMGRTKVNGVQMDNEVLAAQLAQMLTNTGKYLAPSDKDESGGYRWSIQYVDTKQSSGENPFKQFLDNGRENKFQAMGIPDIDSASFGGADAMTDYLIIIIENLVNQMETVIQSDVVNPLIDNNYGPAAISKVKVEIDKSGLGRKRLFKDILINVLRMSASIPGYEPRVLPSMADICADLGVPMKTLEQALRPSSVPGIEQSGESLLDEMMRDEASNDPDQHQVNKSDQTDQERNNRKNSVTDVVN